MKQFFNRLVIFLCIALSGVTQLQANYPKAIKNVFNGYRDYLARIPEISVAHPFAVLNIGSHDPDEDQLLKADTYKKLIRSLRSSLADARRGALKVTAFFKTKTGKRVLYETGLFSLLMAGGYKVWLQNQQTQERIDTLQGAFVQHAADSLSYHVIAQSRHEQLQADIAAVDANTKRRVNQVRDDFEYEIGGAKEAMRILAAEVRAPNRVQAAASTVRSGFAGIFQGARERVQAARQWKADWDTRLEQEERDFNAQLAAEGSDDEDDLGSDRSGASADEGELRGIEKRIDAYSGEEYWRVIPRATLWSGYS